MIKKILKFLGILIVLLLAALFILPVVFKDDIVAMAKEEANKNLNAKVDFGEFDLGLISSFPNFTFTINDVKVEGVDRFEGTTLAKLKTLDLKVDLMSVISGDQISVKEILIVNPEVNAVVLPDSTANWDIAKASSDTTATEEAETGESSSFKLALENFDISGANITYSDATMDMDAVIKNLNFNLSGDFTADQTSIDTKTDIESIDLNYGGVGYMKQTAFTSTAVIDADLKNARYTFKENEFNINDLGLGLDGWLHMPEEKPMDMDLKFKASQTTFKSILSLVPAVYMKDFQDVKTEGKLALDGFMKGTYTETKLPAFEFNLAIDDGMFRYPDLPKSVNDIQVKMKVDNPGGSEDATTVNISKFHMAMAGNPFDMNMFISTPVSDPNIDGAIKGRIDLASLKDVMPMEEGESINGLITSDVILKGKMSTLEQERYEDFTAEGNITVENMDYKSEDLGYGVLIKKTSLNFSPKFVELASFDSKIGESDIKASGKIQNFIGYTFSDEEVLKGNFVMNSNLMNLNEFMEEEEEAASGDQKGEEGDAPKEESAEEEPLEVIEVPGNLDFILAADMKKLVYDDIDIENVKGKMIIRNKKVMMEDVTMNLLKGSMKMNGSYGTVDPKAPSIDFAMDIKDFDVNMTGEKFNTVEKMAPIIKSAKGTYSSTLTVKGTLDQQMEPIMESLNGDGSMKTKNIKIEDFKPLVKVGEALKNDELKRMYLGNSNINFEFKDGKVYVDTFKVKMDDIDARVAGWNSFDQKINYVMKLPIPREKFGGEANAVMDNLISKAQSAGVDPNIGDIINVDVLITGTVDKPKISTNLKDAAGKVKDNIKDQVKDKVDEEVDKAKEKAKEEARKKAEELAKKIEKEAKEKADKIRAEGKKAAEKVKKEGYARAQQIEDEAKNPLAKVAAEKAADKVRKETDKKAQQIIDEANKKADKVEADAKERADKIRAKAAEE